VTDSSYSVAAESLSGLAAIDSAAAVAQAKKMYLQPYKNGLLLPLSEVLIRAGDERIFDKVMNEFRKMPVSENKLNFLSTYAGLLAEVEDLRRFRKGVDLIEAFRESIPFSYRGQTDPYINGVILKGIMTKKQQEKTTEQADYVRSKLKS
jgi:aminopeptidase N